MTQQNQTSNLDETDIEYFKSIGVEPPVSDNITTPPPAEPSEDDFQVQLQQALSALTPPPFPSPMESKIMKGDVKTLESIEREAEEIRLNKEANKKRIEDLVAQVGGTLNIDSTESADLLGVMGQIRLGFADNEQQYKNALETTLGADNVRIIFDKDAKGFEPRHYISVKKEDGTFTDFSAPSQGFFDYAQRIAPDLAYDFAGDAVAAGAAYATASAALAPLAALPVVGVPAASILAIPMAIYAGYATNKGAEVAKNYLREKLGLTEEESTLFDNLYRTAVPLTGTRGEEIAGGVGALPAGIGLLVDKVGIAMSKSIEKLGPIVQKLREQIYPSALKAQKFAKKEKLPEIILPQMTPTQLVSRVASLVSQVSPRLPKKYRDQNQAILKYMQEFGEDVGQGDVKQFQKLLLSIPEQIDYIKKNPPKDVSPEDLGAIIKQSEDLFINLRTLASRQMYQDIFDQTKGAAYNLDNIRALVPKNYKTITPISDKAEKGPIAFGLPPAEKFDTQFERILDDIMSLGKMSEGGRTLNPQQISAALKKFKEEHPEFKPLLEYGDIDSTAKILQLYASRLGKMANEVYAKGSPFYNPQKSKLAMDLRNALLNKIGEPTNLKLTGNLKQELKDANEFYKETFEDLGTRFQVKARMELQQEGPIAEVAEKILGRTEPLFEPLQKMTKQEQYISQNISRIVDGKNPEVAKNIKIAISQTLSNKMAYATGTRVTRESVDEPIKYFNQFTKKELNAIGFTDAEIKDINKSLNQLRRLEDSKVVPKTQATMLTEDVRLSSVFKELFNSSDLDLEVGIREIVDIISKLPAKKQAKEFENFRKGIMNYIISSQSGVIKNVNKDSAYQHVGTQLIDVDVFSNILEKLKTSGVADKFLKEGDLEKLDNIFTYAAVVQGQTADAGSALAGAQIFGNLFTLDPQKFLNAITKLSAQARVAAFLDSSAFSNLVLKQGKDLSQAERIRKMFLGKQFLGNVMATFVLEGTKATSVDQQTDSLLYGPSSPTDIELDATDKEFMDQILKIGTN